MGLVRCPKISWTLVHKRFKTGQEFLPPSLFRFVTVHRTPHPLCGINVAPTATLNETALGSSAAQIWSPKRYRIGNAIASGGLEWQYIAIIATFSSLFTCICLFNGALFHTFAISLLFVCWFLGNIRSFLSSRTPQQTFPGLRLPDTVLITLFKFMFL